MAKSLTLVTIVNIWRHSGVILVTLECRITVCHKTFKRLSCVLTAAKRFEAQTFCILHISRSYPLDCYAYWDRQKTGGRVAHALRAENAM